MELCDVCGKLFLGKYQLLRHRRRVHEKLYQALCNVCGKSIRSDNLARHMKFHKNQQKEVRENERDDSKQKTDPVPSTSKQFPSKLCPTCLIEVPTYQWQYHLRTNNHKLKAAVLHPDGFKVSINYSTYFIYMSYILYF